MHRTIYKIRFDFLSKAVQSMDYPNNQGNPAGAIPVYGTFTPAGTTTPLTPLGYSQITLSGAMHISPPTGATLAVIQCEGQAARWRDDGVAPTATVGMLLAPGAELQYNGALGAIDFIAAVAGAILDISFYK